MELKQHKGQMLVQRGRKRSDTVIIIGKKVTVVEVNPPSPENNLVIVDISAQLDLSCTSAITSSLGHMVTKRLS